jgi:hypothetical protein
MRARLMWVATNLFVDYAGDTVPVIVDRLAAAVGAAGLEP